MAYIKHKCIQFTRERQQIQIFPKPFFPLDGRLLYHQNRQLTSPINCSIYHVSFDEHESPHSFLSGLHVLHEPTQTSPFSFSFFNWLQTPHHSMITCIKMKLHLMKDYKVSKGSRCVCRGLNSQQKPQLKLPHFLSQGATFEQAQRSLVTRPRRLPYSCVQEVNE